MPESGTAETPAHCVAGFFASLLLLWHCLQWWTEAMTQFGSRVNAKLLFGHAKAEAVTTADL